MPIRHGNTYRALGWLAVASLCTALYVGEALGQVKNDVPGESPESPPQTITQQEDSSAPLVTPPQPAEAVASPKIYEPDCDHPDSREDADLCAQRRMANAAKDTIKWIRLSVEWAERQYYATIGEIVALLVTIGVAAIAVCAAFGANKIARKSAERQLRAYVSLSPAGIDYDVRTQRPIVIITQKNNGQTPARVARFMPRAEGLPYPLPDTYEFPPEDFGTDTNTIHPGHEFQVRYVCSDTLLSDLFQHFPEINQRMYFIGAIEYKDVFGKRRITRVCWSYDNHALYNALEALERQYASAQAHLTIPSEVEFYYADRYNTAD